MSSEPLETREMQFRNSNCPRDEAKTPGFRPLLLGPRLLHEIISHPVPLDMNTLTALKRCALGLDLYLWLTTAPSPSVLRCGSHGGTCTASSG